jgi:ribose transport system substrate-binding protein
MPNRFRSAAATLVMLWASAAWANLNIGIVTFSTSDLHTNQMVDTMSGEAKVEGLDRRQPER